MLLPVYYKRSWIYFRKNRRSSLWRGGIDHTRVDEEKRVGVADRAKKKEKGARTRRDGRHLTRATTLGLHNHRQNRWVWICGDVVGCWNVSHRYTKKRRLFVGSSSNSRQQKRRWKSVVSSHDSFPFNIRRFRPCIINKNSDDVWVLNSL